MAINNSVQTNPIKQSEGPQLAKLPLPTHKILPTSILGRIFDFETEAEKASMPRVCQAWDEVVALPIIRKKLLFRGSQEGCSGPVSVSKVESIRATLDARHELGIRFNRAKVSDTVEGGTCSAMALEFLSDYFKARKITSKQPGSSTNALLHQLRGLGKKFSTSSEEFRNRQAAFNTIEISNHGKIKESNLGAWTPFYAKHKIQSLANYHSFVVDYSKAIDAEHATEAEVFQALADLPEGAYLLRGVKPDKSAKLEEFGHSMIYIKGKGFTLFYDPNFGLKNLSSAKHSKAIYNSFKIYLGLGFTSANFYRLAPKTI
jgi:hypothetical protein